MRANPPSNAPHGLDVQPLSERVWLDDFGQLARVNESELSWRVYRRRECIFRSVMVEHVINPRGNKQLGETFWPRSTN